MKRIFLKTHRDRRGAILVLAAVMMAVLVGMVAFAVDYGYLVKVRTDLQRSADAAALAAVQDLIRKPDGTQDVDKTRDTARNYARDNLDDASIQVATTDIEIGRYDPSTIYTGVTLLNNGTFDTVRVTLRRDGSSNSKAPTFFARALGVQNATVTASATAVLQKARIMEPGAEILPFAVPKTLWDSLDSGDTWSGYGDGKLKDDLGNDVPGNWGTVDIGATDNSTAELVDQINNGLRQDDIDELFADGKINQDTHIDSAEAAWMQYEPGLSGGMKSAVQAAHGTQKVVPFYDQSTGTPGNNGEFHIVGWGVVTVVDSKWQGQNNTYVTLKKSDMFEGDLRPNDTLDDNSGNIEGAYTSPVLVE